MRKETDFAVPSIDQAACKLCGVCVEVCPEDALAMQNGELVYTQAQKCTFCTLCEQLCPFNAIRCEYSIAWNEKEG